MRHHTSTTTATQIQQTAHECDFHGCHEAGEHVLLGDARLCLVHFLRDRVRLNLARCTDAA